MKTPTPDSGPIAAWLDRVALEIPDDPAIESAKSLLAAVVARAAFSAVRGELAATLQLLDELDLDVQTRVAFLLHALQQCGGEIEAKTVAEFNPGLRDLLEGQQAAEQVGGLYAARSGGNAEGLRRLLLAIIRDLRVVFILLARQLARLRAAAKLRPSSAANWPSSPPTSMRRWPTGSASGS